MSYHNKQDPLSLILMRDIINHPSEFIPNVSLEVRWTDILGTFFHVDKKSGQNCLIIVHTNGLIIYDLYQRNIKQRYQQRINGECRIQNMCCIDPKKQIVYINVNCECKVITFHLITRKWNLDFLDYSENRPRVAFCSGLAFIPSPFNEVRIQLTYFNNTFEIFKFDNKERLKVLQPKITRYPMDRFKYIHNYMDSNVYIIREMLKDYSEFNIDTVLGCLFQKRSYNNIKTCYIVWDQILLFIFEDSIYDESKQLFTEFYSIDCVDIRKPNEIYFDIKKLRMHPMFDAICLDDGYNLHQIYTNNCFSEEDIHSKYLLKNFIPTEIIYFNKKKNLSIINDYCSFWVRRLKMKDIPKVLNAEIGCFYSIFQNYI